MSIDPQAVIAAAQAEAVRKANEHRKEIADLRRKHDLIEEEKQDFIRTFLRPASAKDYHEWLHGYILTGGDRTLLRSRYRHPRPVRRDDGLR